MFAASCSTYVKAAGVVAIKGNDGLAARVQLYPILGPESGHDLDAIRAGGRHGGDGVLATWLVPSELRKVDLVPG
jgi:hypothetical protein